MVEPGLHLAIEGGVAMPAVRSHGDSPCPAMELDMKVRHLFAALALSATVANAQTLQNAAGIAYYAPSIGRFATLSSNLNGMTVSGTFTDGRVFSAQWANLGGGSSGVVFAGLFSLTMPTDSNSFSTPFNLTVFGTSNFFSKLTLSGATGPVVFDRTFGSTVGTLDSQNGRDFLLTTTDAYNTLVTYRNAVGIVGSSGPVGDIYESMDIEFRTAIRGTNRGRSLQFYQDLDNVITGGLIMPVPEPSTMLLTATGLTLGLVGVRRRQRKATASAVRAD
jgi:hypothetical protein